jgi:hypothetical protein
MNTDRTNLSAATVLVDDATDALGLAIEALEWLGTLAHQIVTSDASQHVNLATLAEFVADHGIANARDAIERIGGNASLFRTAA